MRSTGWLPEPVKSRLKIRRAAMFARAGSDRYAYPALGSLDRLMLERLPLRGTFLEIGANDGYSQSNTYHLGRHRGWTGILIEPVPWLFKICSTHRSEADCFNLACVGVGGPATLRLADRGLMTVPLGLLPADEERRRVGTASTFVEVETATLSGVIDRSSLDEVTFMSIDVEGVELEVLAGLDLARHCPEYLLVETAREREVSDILGSHMQFAERLTHHDFLYVRK